MTVFTNMHNGQEWMYLHRSNFDEVARKTGKSREELEEIIAYQEEQGNHYAPVQLPKPRHPVQPSRLSKLRKRASLGTDEG